MATVVIFTETIHETTGELIPIIHTNITTSLPRLTIITSIIYSWLFFKTKQRISCTEQVQVSFATTMVQRMYDEPSISTATLIGTLGGTLNLWIGIGFVTLFELLELLLQLWCCASQNANKTGTVFGWGGWAVGLGSQVWIELSYRVCFHGVATVPQAPAPQVTGIVWFCRLWWQGLRLLSG